MYYWTGWYVDDSTDKIPDKFIITIWTPDDVEMAVIIHRHSDEYPIDGKVAHEKMVNAQQIVEALNSFTK